MKVFFELKIFLFTGIIFALSSCGMSDQIMTRVEQVNQYQETAIFLAKENRELKNTLSSQRFEIQKLKSRNNYLGIQLDKIKHKRKSRTIASVNTAHHGDDDVKFDIFKWTPKEALSMAKSEFSKKNFKKSAQFFNAFASNYPKHKYMTDEFFFQAGIAAYESGDRHEWTMQFFGDLVNHYPTSKYYRGAKLWMALTNLKLGKKDKFFATVEEFRKKYRNTSEWKVLSRHYEKIVQNYKN